MDGYRTLVLICINLLASSSGSSGQSLSLTPAAVSVTEGESVTLTCSYTFDGSCAANLQCNLNDVTQFTLLWDNENCIKFSGGDAFTFSCTPNQGSSCIYTLTTGQIGRDQHNKQWQCGVAGATSNKATVYVKVPITAVQLTSPATSSVSVIEHVTYKFVCKTSAGRPQAIIEWFKRSGNGAEVALPGGSTSPESSGTLIITRNTLGYTARKADEGYRIYCKASNVGPIFISSQQPVMSILYAPVIQPIQKKDVLLASPLTVPCVTSAGNPPQTSYRWTWSGGDSWSQTGQTLNISRVAKTDAGVYTCTAWNVMTPTGGTQVNGAVSTTFTLNVLYAPVIQPIQDRDAVIASPLRVQCVTIPGNPPQTSYRWTRSGSSSWSQTGQTLSLSHVEKTDAGVYTCTAWNVMIPTVGTPVNGTVSMTFTLNVLYAPVIQPIQNRDVVLASHMSVQCNTTASNPPQTLYRWTRSGGGSWSQTGQTLTISSVEKTDAGVYTCTAWNVITPTGGTQVKGEVSTTFTLNVLYAPVTQPIQNRDVLQALPLTVQCVTIPGNPPQTSYRWTRSGDGSWSQTGQTLSLSSVEKTDAGVYTCTAWNVMIPTGGTPVNGAVSTTFTLNVLYAPVTQPIQDQDVVLALPLTVQCVTTPGNPQQTTYRWTRSGGGSWSQTGPTLSISRVEKTDAGVYTCTAWNVMKPIVGTQVKGEVSTTFTLNVLYKASITSFKIAEETGTGPYTADEKSRRTFRCEVDSNPTSEIQIAGADGTILAQKTNSLSVTYEKTLGCHDAGKYSCSGYNIYNGEVKPTKELELFVRCHPRSAELNITVYKALHESVSLNSSVTAYPPPTYKWFKADNNGAWSILPSVDKQAYLTIENLQEADFRQYKVEVTNNIPPDMVLYYVIEAIGIPDIPVDFTLIAALEMPTFVWDKRNNGGYNQTFIIEVSPEGMNKWTQTLHINEWESKFRLPSGLYIAEMKGLYPGSYSARILSKNVFGTSNASELGSSFLVSHPATSSQDHAEQSPATGIAASVIAGIEAIVIIAFVIYIIRHRHVTRKDEGRRIPVENENALPDMEPNNELREQMNSDGPYYNIKLDAAAGQHTEESRNVYEKLDPVLKKDGLYEAIQTREDEWKQDTGAEYINLNV